MLSFFGPLMGLAFLALLIFEVIFNAIDLRHGINGLPAGFYPPIALAIVSFSTSASIAFFAVNLTINGNKGIIPPIEIIYHVFLFVLPFLDWLLFHEKGAVRYRSLVFFAFVPLFYWVFIFFRALIWPNNPLVGDSLYPYFFMDPSSPYYWPGVILALIYFLGIGALYIFLGDVFSGKLKKKNVDLR